MPAIKQKERVYYDTSLQSVYNSVSNVHTNGAFAKGHLTYIFYKLAVSFAKILGHRYTFLSMVHSCLIDAANEFYRKQIAPYEEEKYEENSPVEPF